jgi:hypothetical protein
MRTRGTERIIGGAETVVLIVFKEIVDGWALGVGGRGLCLVVVERRSSLL